MKAIDYLEKYGDGIEEHCQELVEDFLMEAQEIVKKRNIKQERALLAVRDEQNLKWNKLCKLAEKKYGRPVLKPGAILKIFVIEPAPETTSEDADKEEKPNDVC